MKLNYFRFLQTGLFLLSLSILLSVYYFQYVKGLAPCPLCMMQRVCLVFILFGLLSSLLTHTYTKNRKLLLFNSAWALAGLCFAGRQLWLQSLPITQPATCMPGLDAMLHYFPWQETLRALFLGTHDCQEVQWQWLGLSMPAWSGLYFIFLGFAEAALFIFFKTNRNHDKFSM